MIVRLLPLLAAFLMWASFAPIGIGWLVFPAIFCWLVLIAWPGQLPRHSYKLLYLGSFLAWLALLQGIRLAYWPLYAGWIALAFYVAFYIPLFVFVSRFLIYRWRWPLALAAPVVWAGCELLRCYVMTGFGGCLLSHTMARHPIAIQLASHLGPHLLSGLYVFVAATVLDYCRTNSALSNKLWPNNDGVMPFASSLNKPLPQAAVQSETDDTPIIPGNRAITKLELLLQSALVVTVIVSSVLLYMQGTRLQAHAKAPLLKVALIQENAETRFEYSEERANKSFNRYFDLTWQAGQQHPDLDLVVWPESIYTLINVFFEWDEKRLPDNYAEYISNHRTAHEDAKIIKQIAIAGVRQLQRVAGGADKFTPMFNPKDNDGNKPALLLGGSVHNVKHTGFKPYNSVIFQPKDAGPIELYDKRKLVMFGEYIPFAQKWPEVYRSLGMVPLGVGKIWKAFKVDDVTVAPSICFEDMIPQAMQDQVAFLKRKGTPPDVLVSVTNDGWFRGSSMLDHHFACAIFTAVENRRPMLVAANTGLSGWISGNGQIMAESEKLEAAIVIAQPTADGRWGLWQIVGDWPARVCAAVIVLTLLSMLWSSQVKSYYERRNEPASNAQSE